MTKTSFDRMPSRRSSLSFLLVATSFAATLACGLTDDDDKGDKAQDSTDKTDTAALEPAGPGGNTPNGLAFPQGVQDWGVVGAATRADQGELHVVVGNAKAVQAARSGQTNPWPDGSALAHLAFKAEQNPDDPVTINAGAFSAVTLMMKDSAKYAADGGWAYGAWMGESLTPPAAGFDRACVDCHTSQVKDKDYVFTDPGQLPTQAQVDAAADAPNGVAFPDKILDWRVIGMARVSDANGGAGTLRVIVGNPTAVTAARSGNTDPWPDGSMISHYNWAAGSNPDIDKTTPKPGDAVTPAGFNAFTLMQRSSAQYGDKGDWDYGLWTTPALTAQTDPTFSQGCVDCHTSRVASRDMVFTRMAEFPPMLMPAGASVAR